MYPQHHLNYHLTYPTTTTKPYNYHLTYTQPTTKPYQLINPFQEK